MREQKIEKEQLALGIQQTVSLGLLDPESGVILGMHIFENCIIKRAHMSLVNLNLQETEFTCKTVVKII